VFSIIYLNTLRPQANSSKLDKWIIISSYIPRRDEFEKWFVRLVSRASGTLRFKMVGSKSSIGYERVSCFFWAKDGDGKSNVLWGMSLLDIGLALVITSGISLNSELGLALCL
jgi:hypothetical protein